MVSLIVPDAATDGQLATNYFGLAIGDAWTLQSPGPWLVEVLFSFLLMLVILNVALSSATSGNPYYGLAIGFIVMAAAYTGGAVSGAALNPAVGIGPNLVKSLLGGDSSALNHAVLYVVGPVTGASAAVVVFKLQEDYLVSQKVA